MAINGSQSDGPGIGGDHGCPHSDRKRARCWLGVGSNWTRVGLGWARAVPGVAKAGLGVGSARQLVFG